MDQVTKLRLAIAGSRHGHGDAHLARQARQRGVAAFEDVLGRLSPEDLDGTASEAEDLAARGISAVLLGSSEYPESLAELRSSPPLLFYRGPSEMLKMAGVGVCGSRSASEEGLRAAAACGEIASRQDLAAISGYARGVDMATHISALRSGGSTVIVLAEGIQHFRVKRGDFAEVWDPKRVLVVSQFAPSRPWSAGSAMARNAVIIGLSLALIVVEAGEKGGTLAAGTKALGLHKRVIALEFSEVPRGNVALIKQGAIAAKSGPNLSNRIASLLKDQAGNQLKLV
jgi:DNA processing protein